ncbi:phosphoribosylaminoimidazole-succinocarboxamide synthase [Halalkaliarchaeum desulfuricum]|uniref:phosphoribosylaminoimidazolesuccinocarboxamide synthase n=1 Tax=Halalkaliarchaeum desulfuricum TaxID=2055893 RepID=A0A343TFJ8_9EURY|nr:phosphoribosylaminoimidazolesuccinocarboxamide synthase [Halalkaliarchaeum desulfuricum]AUX07870.1 phosphoribosylaminoimidazole-succinocarboxamide synthase [Halalkaliarchaeum desulfuricum]
MTSVKEFRIETEPTATDAGRGRFYFTDAYSVFDWGQMPDPIPNKGASLCVMGADNFERLETEGIPTHYRGVVPATGDEAAGNAEATSLSAAAETVTVGGAEPPREMAIELTQVPDLPYDGESYGYDAYHAEAGDNYLVPLEVVFRNTVPVGSSLRSRTDPGNLGLDFDSWPDETVELPEPVVEFSTKYEEQDRYLDRGEADEIAGKADVDDLEVLAREVNDIVTEQATGAGFVHEDGKIEVMYHDGTLRVADVVGTFDENRFSYGGQELSKEVIRQWYKREQPEWVDAVAAAKREVAQREIADWRQLCSVEPTSLPANVLEVVSNLYTAGANAYTGREWFDAPPIGDVVETVRRL